ncbi:PREDICTED: uncharacterized protein LOC109179689 isoform X4 [Ipomoea nil]|uniref:uncharacterized protein LOC109179689 isoform X4 n=1 Tax=Ipomoea nil TaxID=35883 RepID=UPI000901FA02|nr:PREDICTED: uncharacterized protein LOC109179689 isoform X4 [Ipomoea nil]
MEYLVKKGETFQYVPVDILAEQPSSSSAPAQPPPGFSPSHGYVTRQAKASLPSTTKRGQRIIPGPKHMNNAAAPHNLEHQIELVGSNDDEEVSSARDNFLVKVDRGYRVKPENAPLIKKIFARYGDIVKGSSLQSVECRSSFLEIVCSVYQRLDTMDILNIAAVELKSMLDLVSDLELAKVEIGWLRCRVEQIYEAKKSVMEARSLKATRTKALEDMEGKKKKAVADTKQELEFGLEACRVLQKKLEKLEDDVGIAGVEMDKINERYSNMNTKVQRFYHHPLVSDLL